MEKLIVLTTQHLNCLNNKIELNNETKSISFGG